MSEIKYYAVIDNSIIPGKSKHTSVLYVSNLQNLVDEFLLSMRNYTDIHVFYDCDKKDVMSVKTIKNIKKKSITNHCESLLYDLIIYQKSSDDDEWKLINTDSHMITVSKYFIDEDTVENFASYEELYEYISEAIYKKYERKQ